MDNSTNYFMEKLLTTQEAAELLRRKPQTLRFYASQCDNPPIRPIRTRPNSPLLWRLSDIRKFMEGEQPGVGGQKIVL